jgi:hypothetical protein
LHKRAINKLLGRKIRRIVQRGSYYDKQRGETVSKMTRSEILDQVEEPVEVDLVPDLEKGEVLLDSRVRGSFQRQ